MASIGTRRPNQPFTPLAPQGVKPAIDRAIDKIRRDPLTKTMFQRVDIAKEVELLDSTAWSARIKEGVFSYETIASKGAGAQQLVDFTYYKDKMNTVDDFVAERVHDWPVLAAYNGAVTSLNPFAMQYVLYNLQAYLGDSSISTMSAARFMGAVNSVWCSSEKAPFIDIRDVRPLIEDFAWELLFTAPPTAASIEFIDEFYRVNFGVYAGGTALQGWNGEWNHISRSNKRMAAFLDVASALMMAHKPLEICEWHFVSTHLSCFAFISLKGMTTKKWERLRGEMAATAQATSLPAVNEVKELGPDIRSFLIRSGSYVSTFIALGQRTCSQTLHIYMSNTYSRSVLAGMAALTVIVDLFTTLPNRGFWCYLFRSYPTDAANLASALELVASRPYIGFCDNTEKLEVQQSRFASIYACCYEIRKVVLGDSNIEGLIRKAPTVPAIVLETLAKAMKEELAKKPDLVSTPEEVLKLVENFQGMVTYFDQTVKAGTL